MSDDNKEFEGVTLKDCCAGCKPNRCVITGNQFCGHPNKASHPTAGQKVTERIIKVKKILAHQRAGAA